MITNIKQNQSWTSQHHLSSENTPSMTKNIHQFTCLCVWIIQTLSLILLLSWQLELAMDNFQISRCILMLCVCCCESVMQLHDFLLSFHNDPLSFLEICFSACKLILTFSEFQQTIFNFELTFDFHLTRTAILTRAVYVPATVVVCSICIEMFLIWFICYCIWFWIL